MPQRSLHKRNMAWLVPDNGGITFSTIWHKDLYGKFLLSWTRTRI